MCQYSPGIVQNNFYLLNCFSSLRQCCSFRLIEGFVCPTFMCLLNPWHTLHLSSLSLTWKWSGTGRPWRQPIPTPCPLQLPRRPCSHLRSVVRECQQPIKAFFGAFNESCRSHHYIHLICWHDEAHTYHWTPSSGRAWSPCDLVGR